MTASKANKKTIIIGDTSSFWRYSNEDGFDLTRRNDDQTGPSISFQTTTIPIRIDPTRSAIVIIDMQNFFLHPNVRDHDTGLDASNKLLKHIIPQARKAAIQIIWLNWGLTEDDLDQLPPGLKRIFDRGTIDRLRNVETSSKRNIYGGFGSEMGMITLPSNECIDAGRLLMRDTWNARLFDPLFHSYQRSQETFKPDLLFHKNRISGLWSYESPLLSYLYDKNITTLFFAGVNTDQCVSGTFNDAFSKGFDYVLLRDGCGTTSPSFATECIEYNCAGGGGFILTAEQFEKGIETSLK